MIIEIDLSTAPPATTLLEPDDFGGFKVVVRGADDAFVSPEALRALAGERGADAAWLARLDGMLAYAATKGWVREEDGAIRAHVEHA